MCDQIDNYECQKEKRREKKMSINKRLYLDFENLPVEVNANVANRTDFCENILIYSD